MKKVRRVTCAIAASLPMVGLTLLSSQSVHAKDQPICGPEIKAEVAKYLNEAAGKGAAEQEKIEKAVYEKYSYCAADANEGIWLDSFFIAARQCGAKVSYLGNTFYEEMPCCGYDPQRRTFACPVKIKQQFGFGPSPLPGSREFVLHCVADGAGVFHPVGFDSVHLSDSVFAPTWQFAVIANAIQNLWLVQPMNGTPRIARSILSWQFQPRTCDFKPIWGNVLDYQIRLDQ